MAFARCNTAPRNCNRKFFNVALQIAEKIAPRNSSAFKLRVWRDKTDQVLTIFHPSPILGDRGGSWGGGKTGARGQATMKGKGAGRKGRGGGGREKTAFLAFLSPRPLPLRRRFSSRSSFPSPQRSAPSWSQPIILPLNVSLDRSCLAKPGVSLQSV